MNGHYRNDIDMNETLHNVDVTSVIFLLNSHTLPQDNDSSNLNEMNISGETLDVNGDYFYLNNST